MDATFTPADTLSVGDQVCEADGFLLQVVAIRREGRAVVLTLEPQFGSMTWPAGERREQRVGRNRMVRVA